MIKLAERGRARGGRPRVLAVSSSGGHWEQLLLVTQDLADCDVHYAVTMQGLAERSGLVASIIPDFNANQPLKLVLGLSTIARLVWKARPQVAISTGAAPGVVALGIAKLLGARTMWIDSVANAERLSLSGRLARVVADVTLTQWRHLARPNGPYYVGAVL